VPVATETDRRPTRPLPKHYDRRRILVAAMLVAAVVAGFAGIAGTACSPDSLRQAATTATTPAGSAHVGDQAKQDIQAIVDRLSAGLDAAYTAQYAMLDGNAVTVTQAPPRHAYRGLGVTFLLSPDLAMVCSGTPVRCERAPGADSLSPSQVRAVSAAFMGRFVTTEYVIGRLISVGGQPAVRTGRGSRTIGGGPADCVAATASGVPPQTACVTATGALAYFAGTAPTVGGASPGTVTIRLELHAYTSAVAPDAFTPPKPSDNDSGG
jgi:hypothetical protein